MLKLSLDACARHDVPRLLLGGGAVDGVRLLGARSMALLQTPLGTLLNAAATGTLDAVGPLQWQDGSAVTVVVAAENYPGRPRVGDVITGSETAGVLHAGTTRRDDGSVVSSGGRVLSVVGTGADLAAARAEAYRIIESIRLPGSHFRTDIGLAAAEGRISL